MDTGENSLPAVLSRLTACDGLSFRVIAMSKDLRRGLMAMGHSHVPTSVESIRQQVLKHGQVIRSVVKADLDRKKKEGERFSITMDECDFLSSDIFYVSVMFGLTQFLH